MQILAKMLNTLTSSNIRHFKARLLSGQIANVMQFHGGGDDFCPAPDTEAVVGEILNNANHKYVYCWKDSTPRKAKEGEKRIYAIKDGAVCGEIWLKNNGEIELTGDAKMVINCQNAEINAQTETTINSPVINLGGAGGAAVLTENSTILDSNKKPCIITANTVKTKAQ